MYIYTVHKLYIIKVYIYIYVHILYVTDAFQTNSPGTCCRQYDGSLLLKWRFLVTSYSSQDMRAGRGCLMWSHVISLPPTSKAASLLQF